MVNSEGIRVVEEEASLLVQVVATDGTESGRQGGFGEVSRGNLRGDVGAHEDTALEIVGHVGVADTILYLRGYEVHLQSLLVEVDLLDERHTSSVGLLRNYFLNGWQDGLEKLERHDKNDKRRVDTGSKHRRDCRDVVGEVNVGKVLDIHLLIVHDPGKLGSVWVPATSEASHGEGSVGG